MTGGEKGDDVPDVDDDDDDDEENDIGWLMVLTLEVHDQ